LELGLFISNAIYIFIVYFRVVTRTTKLRSSFCWYWWRCWPSMLKLSFHNYISKLELFEEFLFEGNVQNWTCDCKILRYLQWIHPPISTKWTTYNLWPSFTKHKKDHSIWGWFSEKLERTRSPINCKILRYLQWIHNSNVLIDWQLETWQI
jgi:hypothetical protein